MNVEIVFYLFTILGIFILFLGGAYYQQKIINSFLKRKIYLVTELNFFESKIKQRQVYLNRYNFQKFNLKDVLVS